MFCCYLFDKFAIAKNVSCGFFQGAFIGFSSRSDIYSVVKAEYIAMRLADMMGLNVAPVTNGKGIR